MATYYVIDADGDLNTLKGRNNGTCQGNLQNLNNPQPAGSQTYYCNTGGNINTDFYSTNP
jgi:hypothetical protein